jgi:hypothetical protein
VNLQTTKMADSDSDLKKNFTTFLNKDIKGLSQYYNYNGNDHVSVYKGKNLSKLKDLSKLDLDRDHNLRNKHFKNLKETFTSENGTYQINGVIPTKDLKLFYKTEHGDFSIDFNTKTGILNLLENAGTTATFGLGNEELVDKTVRDAIKLAPGSFALSESISDSGILEEIRRIMMPDVQNVKAVPHSLNVYKDGGHFKKHVDTPRGSTMFGTLVVLLPTNFEGGSFTVDGPKLGSLDNRDPVEKVPEHVEKVEDDSESEESEVESEVDESEVDDGLIDFSRIENSKIPKKSSGSDTFVWKPNINEENSLNYIAFYSDCKHMIEPITDGTRMTITYDLHYIDYVNDKFKDKITKSYREKKTVRTYSNLIKPVFVGDSLFTTFTKNLKNALLDETFLPKGGLLGFCLKHGYAHDSGTVFTNLQNLPKLLKGSDRSLLLAADNLGLDPKLMGVFRGSEDDFFLDMLERDDDYDSDEPSLIKTMCDPTRKFVTSEKLRGHLSGYMEEEDTYGCDLENIEHSLEFGGSTDVYWVNDKTPWGSLENYPYQGNEPSVHTFYGALGLVLEVPAFDKRLVQ